MSLVMGIRVGQKSEPSGLCITEAGGRDVEGEWEVHYTARFLDRVPAGTSYPAVAARVDEVLKKLVMVAGERPMMIYLDATGLGLPIIELMSETLEEFIHPVYFNFGDQRRTEMVENPGSWRKLEIIKLGKAFLVSRLQLLLQSNRLHLPRTPSAEALAKDLLDYEIRVDERANERYGAFRVGGHDDLITALGMALQVEIPISRPRKSTGSISDLRTGLGADMERIFGPVTYRW